jgi:hypothetical protein
VTGRPVWAQTVPERDVALAVQWIAATALQQSSNCDVVIGPFQLRNRQNRRRRPIHGSPGFAMLLSWGRLRWKGRVIMMPKESMNLVRQIGVVVALIATIIVNILANVLPFNGVTTGELAAQFDVLFVPAPYVFSIWTVIYVGLAIYAGYQAQPSLRNDRRLRSLDLPFLLSSVANMTWLFLWHFQFYMATLVVMLILLGSLITIYRRLDIERPTVSPARRWAVHHPFSAYLAWITIAAMANLGVVLDYMGFTGFGLGEATWFTLGVLTVMGVAGVMTWLRTDVVYLLVLMWGLIGIGVARADEPIVASLVWTATAILAVMVAMSAIQRSPDEPDLYSP